jgi:site-specific recombinase XerD
VTHIFKAAVEKQGARHMDMPLSIAVEGWLLTCSARSFSPNTIDGYGRTLRKFIKFLGDDPPIRSITTKHIEAFLIAQPVSRTSKLDYYVGLSSLWTWALKEGLVNSHQVRALERPKADTRQVEPYTEAEIKHLVHEASGSSLYNLKMRATLMLLLDTGLRASEVCSLTIGNLHLKEGHALVMGKGNKERQVEFGPRTGQAIWKYLASRGNLQPNDRFLISRTGKHLDRDELAHRLQSLGRRAGVEHCHPHRFRHTFAVMFLRNGGSSLALQRLLGHSTMEMVRIYVKLSEVDLQQAHRRASPVENLRL